jgi:hypothetical protein
MKPVRIVMSEEAKQDYEILIRVVGEEISKGVKSSDNQKLLKSIKRAIDLLKMDPQFGIHISRKLIPKAYVEKYGIDNLWKFDLTGYWRMLYSLKTTEVELISFVLDIVDHPTYDKIFGYKKR